MGLQGTRAAVLHTAVHTDKDQGYKRQIEIQNLPCEYFFYLRGVQVHVYRLLSKDNRSWSMAFFVAALQQLLEQKCHLVALAY